jgi:TetR/AcrR family transcriptional regulator, transcriptional repressor for nem operon
MMAFIPRSEKTRQFIIETTASLFNKKGYEGTSMSDLTEATKLTKGSIYGNFENKEDVALAAFKYNLDKRNQLIIKKVNEANSSYDKLMVFPTLYSSSEMYNFLEEGGCPLLNTGVESDDDNELFRTQVVEGVLNWKQSLENIIEEGIKNHEFTPDTEISKTATSIIALIQGGVFLTKTTKNPILLNQVLDTAKEMIQKITL